jgi:hypothetical protein
MSSDRVLDRLRAANPARAVALADADLFARIVAGPADARLAASSRKASPHRRWLRMGTRQLAFLAASVVVGAAGGTVGAIKIGVISHASPKTLFRANPVDDFPSAPREEVVPNTVHLATTFTIPGVGRFEWWIALSTRGWLCQAIRQPDGTWADIANDKYQLGGPVPGCGGWTWHDRYGFAYYPTSIRSPHGRQWRVAYGYAPTIGHPVDIRDKVSGATAPIGDGRYFAIVMPLCSGKCNFARNPPPGFRLQTLDRRGRVLVTDQFDPGM